MSEADKQESCQCGKHTCGCGKRAALLAAILIALGIGYAAGTALSCKRAAPCTGETVVVAEEAVVAAPPAVAPVDADAERLATLRKDLENKVQTLQASLLESRADGAQISAENTALKQSLKAANDAISDLQHSLDNANDTVAAFEKTKAALAEAQARVAALETLVDAQAAKLQVRDGKITALSAQLGEIKTQLSDAQKQIKKLIDGRGGVYRDGGRPLQFRR